MKKLLMLVMIMFLLGCQQKEIVVPLIIYDMEDAFMADFEERISDIEKDGIRIVTYDSKNSQIVQNDIIVQLINEGYRVLIINPVDRLSARAIIRKASKTNTKIIFINREPLAADMELSDSVFYIGARAIESAKLQADLIKELFGNDPIQLNEFDLNDDNIIQAVILKGELGHQDAEARTRYVVKYLVDDYFEVEILETVVANFDMRTAEIEMDQVIKDHGSNMEVVIANNDAMALGAIASLTRNGFFIDGNLDGVIDHKREIWFPVVGIDGLRIALENIKKGHLFGTVLNDSQKMAQVTKDLSWALVMNKSLEDFDFVDDKYIWIDYQKIFFEIKRLVDG